MTAANRAFYDRISGVYDVIADASEREGLTERALLRLGDGRELPYESETFDAAFSSFTLELFELDDIPRVLAEIHRVLRPGGRFTVVSMASVAEGGHPSLLENTYAWMHRHFPHIVDCQPIDAARFLEDAGFEIVDRIDLVIWSMPVAALLGQRS